MRDEKSLECVCVIYIQKICFAVRFVLAAECGNAMALVLILMVKESVAPELSEAHKFRYVLYDGFLR